MTDMGTFEISEKVRFLNFLYPQICIFAGVIFKSNDFISGPVTSLCPHKTFRKEL